jgi:hypothetical protein
MFSLACTFGIIAMRLLEDCSKLFKHICRRVGGCQATLRQLLFVDDVSDLTYAVRIS